LTNILLEAEQAIKQPTQVQKDFERLIREIGTPARPPIIRKIAPGRQMGDLQIKRTRFDKKTINLHSVTGMLIANKKNRFIGYNSDWQRVSLWSWEISYLPAKSPKKKPSNYVYQLVNAKMTINIKMYIICFTQIRPKNTGLKFQPQV
jgi:hypothetical protein